MGRFQLVLVWLVLVVSRESRVIFCFSSLERRVACSPEESLGLLRFKNFFFYSFENSSTVCSNYHHRTLSWREGTDCCLWEGVWCDEEEGHVIGLDLRCDGLSGSMPSNNTGLLLLPHLQELNLAFNYFNGSSIPEDITRLASLTHLNLSQASFTGEVTAELAKLPQLVLLDLSWNSLNISDHALRTVVRNMTNLQQLLLDDIDLLSVSLAPLLDLFSSSLRSLSLLGCGLEGELPNNTFQQLPRLEELHLGGNALTGSFPAGAGTTNNGNGSSRLKFLDLFNTELSGELPDAIGNLRSLEVLDLSGCNFSGSLPASLGNLSSLQLLDLSENYFAGQILDIFVNLTRLRVVDLSYNNFGGPIPSHMAGLQKLTDLRLSYNAINGTIPPGILSLLQQLRDLRLNGNFLTGPLEEFGSRSLEFVDLSDNKLQGSIPNSIFEQVSLSELHLASNLFSGSVEFPKSTNLQSLRVLDFSSNNLTSVTTAPLFNSTFPALHKLHLNSCSLTVFPNFTIESLPALALLNLSNNKIHGEIPSWIGEIGKYTPSLLNVSSRTSIRAQPVFSGEHIFVDLHSNMLQGPIPILKGCAINIFIASENRLTGELPLSICNMSSLNILLLANNSLSGINPECFGNLSSSLSVLNLEMNRLSGIIPDSFVSGCRLTTLNLNGNTLEGPVPQSLAKYCMNLEVLDLGNNKIADTFPYWLGSLPKLQGLVLHSNQFYGRLTDFRSGASFPNLQILDLSRNNFTGLLPTLFFRDLKAMQNASKVVSVDKPEHMGGHSYTLEFIFESAYEVYSFLTISTILDFSHNNFVGELPHSICNMSSLSILLLANNSLSGIIPECLGNLSKSLSILNLEMNRLNGIIPDSFGPNCSLDILNLNGNILEGPVPRSLAKYCTSLQVLDLGNNKIADTFPYWLGSLPELKVLALHSNRFYGRLTDFRKSASFPNLQILDLSRNNFIGLLPTLVFQDLKAMQNASKGISFDKLENAKGQFYILRITFKGLERQVESILTIFKTLDFSHNNFAGKIPKMVGDLGALVVLDFSHNNLTGPIPSSMGNLKQLESLDLSSNKLVGQIPDQLRMLTFLAFLNLSYNKLDGPIPQGLQFYTFENNSYIGNAGLCGLPLSKKCEEPKSALEVPEDDSFMDGFGWRAVAIGYGCGVAFGGLVGCAVFFTMRPLWLASMVENECQRIVKWRIWRDKETKTQQPVLFVF